MGKRGWSKERRAITVAGCSLVVGVIAWMVTALLNWPEPSMAVFSLLLIPVFVYLIVSGHLTELRGPGGFEAKFTRFAGESAVETDDDLIRLDLDDLIHRSVEDMQSVQKAGIEALQKKIRQLDPHKPSVLILQVGPQFSGRTLLEYLKLLAQAPTFRFVLLVDSDGELIGYGPHRQIQTVLCDEEERQTFVSMLNEQNVRGLRNHYAFQTTELRFGANNLEALRAMADPRLDSLVAVDASGRPIGLVGRDQLVLRLLSTLSRTG